MAFLYDDDKYQKWRYRVTEFQILNVNAKPIEIIPDRISSIGIFHDYENNLFPIFRIEIITASTIYYKILQNKSRVKIKLRIQKYYNELAKKKKSLMRDVINDTFDLILDEEDYDSDKPLREESKRNLKNFDTDISNDIVKSNNPIEFYLYKSDIINKMNTNINNVLTNATSTGAIQYIINQSGLKNILMAPADNNKIIPELLIPPLKAKEALMWINNYYGIYKNGFIAYNDFIDGIFYILPYSGGCKAYQYNEMTETNILIPKKNNRIAANELCSIRRASDLSSYYILGTNNVSIRDETISFDVINSVQASSVDSYSGSIDINKNSYGNTTVIENKTENEYYANMYNSIVNSKKIVVNTLLSNYDIDALKPNKKIKLLFEDSTISGNYRGDYILSSTNLVFIKDGSDFSLSTDVELKLLK